MDPDRTATDAEVEEAVLAQSALCIKTECVCPPIPIRSMDWIAWDDNTYDASFEGSDESGDHWKSSPLGYGSSEDEAIADLLEQLGVSI